MEETKGPSPNHPRAGGWQHLRSLALQKAALAARGWEGCGLGGLGEAVAMAGW